MVLVSSVGLYFIVRLSMNDTTQGNGLRRDESGHWLRFSDQRTVAVLVGLGLVVLFAGRWYGVRESLADEAGERPLVEFLVDVNRAGSAELALLPGIGATLAERIIHSRQQEGPFHNARELQRVSGIGPKKVERVASYLIFLPLAKNDQQRSLRLSRPARRLR